MTYTPSLPTLDEETVPQTSLTLVHTPRTLTGIFKQVRNTQKSENTPVPASWFKPYGLPDPQAQA